MEKYAGTQAIARTFAIVKLFDDAQPIWSLQELIEKTGLKRTTAFRILSALEAEGIIRKTERGDYTLGSELIRLGGRAIRSNRLRTVARPYLDKLVHQSKESVTLDILIDNDGQLESMVIEEQVGQHLLGMAQYIGASFQAHSTSTGKVLLAYASQDSLQKLEQQTLTRYTKNTITSLKTLKRDLAQVKKQGYAITLGEREEGLVAVAAPIFNLHGAIRAAVCIGGASSRVANNLDLHAAQVRQAGQAISQALGFEKAEMSKIA